MKPPPTMADVARLAGVSAMTVSRALRRDAAVSSSTRARILEVIEEIGYVPDKTAGSLSSGRSGLVAAIVPTLASPLFAQVAKALGDTISQSGLELQLGASDYSSEREEELLRSMFRRRPEAVALAGVDHTGKTARLLVDAGIPVIEFLEPADPPIDNVVSLDGAAVARAIVSHLALKGRKRIAIAAPRDEAGRIEKRVEALVASVREAGLGSPTVIRLGSSIKPAEQGARAAAAAITSGEPFDAMVFTSDQAAIGGVRTLEDAGKRVPRDVSVFGFGDAEVGRYVRPSITTIGFNPAGVGVEIGKIVLSALEAARRGQGWRPYRLTLDFQLIERESA